MQTKIFAAAPFFFWQFVRYDYIRRRYGCGKHDDEWQLRVHDEQVPLHVTVSRAAYNCFVILVGPQAGVRYSVVAVAI